MMLRSKTMIDDEITNNDFGHSAPFQPRIFGVSSEVNVSLYQTRIEFENVVNDTLVNIGIFYKQVLPLFKK